MWGQVPLPKMKNVEKYQTLTREYLETTSAFQVMITKCYQDIFMVVFTSVVKPNPQNIT